MSRSRAVVSLPCNCRMSGRKASTILSSVASSASTVSATLTARPLACLPSSRAVSRLEMPRRRRKEHEAHHVGAGLQRDVERLARGQAANFDDQGHGFEARFGADRTPDLNRADGAGSTTSRPACLARRTRKGRPATAPEAAGDRPREAAAAARRSASSARACRASASCCRAARRQRRCRNQVAMPPATTPRIATAMMTTNSGSVTRDRRDRSN